jgi:hypothetical protein
MQMAEEARTAAGAFVHGGLHHEYKTGEIVLHKKNNQSSTETQ